MSIDPHDLLGVSRDAAPTEARAAARHAFHRLARVVHPDVGGDASDLRVVSGAYEALAREPAPPQDRTLRALCAELLGLTFEPTVEHDRVCMRLFALGDATLDPGFDVDAFAKSERALWDTASEQRRNKRARLEETLPVEAATDVDDDTRMTSLDASTSSAVQMDDRPTDQRLAALMAERAALS